MQFLLLDPKITGDQKNRHSGLSLSIRSRHWEDGAPQAPRSPINRGIREEVTDVVVYFAERTGKLAQGHFYGGNRAKVAHAKACIPAQS